jgi:hypothetical protein
MVVYNAHNLKLLINQYNNNHVHSVVKDIISQFINEGKINNMFELKSKDLSLCSDCIAYADLSLFDQNDVSIPICSVIKTKNETLKFIVEKVSNTTLQLKTQLPGIRVVYGQATSIFKDNHEYRYDNGLILENIPNGHKNLTEWIQLLQETYNSRIQLMSVFAQIHAMQIALAKNGLYADINGYNTIFIIPVSKNTQINTDHGIINTFGNLVFLGSIYNFKDTPSGVSTRLILNYIFSLVDEHNSGLYSYVKDMHKYIVDNHIIHELSDFAYFYRQIEPEVISNNFLYELSCGQLCPSKRIIIEAITNMEYNYYDQLIPKINRFIEVYDNLKCINSDVDLIAQRMKMYIQESMTADPELISRSSDINLDRPNLFAKFFYKRPTLEEITGLQLKYKLQLPIENTLSNDNFLNGEPIDDGTVFTVKVNMVDRLLDQNGYLLISDEEGNDQYIISSCIKNTDTGEICAKWSLTNDISKNAINLVFKNKSFPTFIQQNEGLLLNDNKYIITLLKIDETKNTIDTTSNKVYDLNETSKMINVDPYTTIESFTNRDIGIGVSLSNQNGMGIYIS